MFHYNSSAIAKLVHSTSGHVRTPDTAEIAIPESLGPRLGLTGRWELALIQGRWLQVVGYRKGLILLEDVTAEVEGRAAV